MENEFISLFKAVGELQQLVEEREKLKEQKCVLSTQARQYRDEVVKTYKEAEYEIGNLIEQAEAEHREHKKEIIELTRQQYKEGANFKDAERLQQLKSDVATHELKVEALHQLKCDVVISAKDQEKISNYRLSGEMVGRAVTDNAYKIIEKLLEIKNLSSTNCPALFDFHILKIGQNVFFDIFADTDKMRKEILQ